jgi:broad specificity phosphatase PhoE
MAEDKRRIFLIRHGETEFNRLGVFRGRYEVDLNDVGRRQAGEIAEALKSEGIDFLLASPLRRAMETAGIIAEALGVACGVDEAFNNINLGSWQGVPKADVMRDYPELWRQWVSEPEELRVPNGETVDEVRARAFRRLEALMEEDTGDFGIVTHRSVLKGLAAAILGVPAPWFWKFYMDNAAYSIFEHTASGCVLTCWNSNAHLSEKVQEVF